MTQTFRDAAAVATLLMLAACSGADEVIQTPDGSGEAAVQDSSADPSATPSSAALDPSATAWDMQSSGEGVALVFPGSGEAAVRMFCPSRQDRILVNVPAFRPIGSEERLSFGSGGNAHALVADTRGDRQRGGVSGTGAVPGNLDALIDGPVSVTYGAQSSGPHPAPPRTITRAFAAACHASPPTATTTSSATGKVSACLIQDGKRLAVTPLRAIGTEPFWGAKIEGRCVTYLHPEDQSGTRVWTTYTPDSGGGGTWSGALDNQKFELRTRPQNGCSDGMSDKRYPLAVELLVGGEQRTGCAEAR